MQVECCAALLLLLLIFLFFAAYDVTRRETFESLDDIWMREVDMYSTVEDSVKMVVANKLDKVNAWLLASERLPTADEN